MRFDYWTVQATPDATLLHTFGVGVIVADPGTGEATSRFLPKDSLPSATEDATASIAATTRMLKELINKHSGFSNGLVFDREDTLRGRLSMLARDWSNIITIDTPRSISANSLTDATEQLFSLFIKRPTAAPQHRPITRLQNTVHETYTAHPRIQRALVPKAKLNTVASTDTLDLAVADIDSQVFEINTSFNFNRNDPQNLKDKIDAWNYRIRELRANGGSLNSNKEPIEIPSTANVVIAYIKPETDRQQEVFEHAASQWQRLDVTPLTASQISAYAQSLDARLLAG